MTAEVSNLRKLPSFMRRSFSKRRPSLDAPEEPPPTSPPSSNWLHSSSPACSPPPASSPPLASSPPPSSALPSSPPWHAQPGPRPSTKVARPQNMSAQSSSLSSSCPQVTFSPSPPSTPEGAGRDELRLARADVGACEGEIARLQRVVDGMERQASEARAAEKLRGARAVREEERQGEIVRLRAVVEALERQIAGVSAAEDGRRAWLGIVEDELRLARAEVRKGLVGIGEREAEVDRLEGVVGEMGREIDEYRAAEKTRLGDGEMRARMEEMEDELRVARDEVRERDEIVREREEEVARLEGVSVGIEREIEEIKRAWAREGTGWFEDAEDGIEWTGQCDRDLENEKTRRALEKALDEARAAAARAEKSLAMTKKSLGQAQGVAAKAEVSRGDARAVAADAKVSLADAVAAKRRAEEAVREERGRREVLESAVAECGARARRAEAAAKAAEAEVSRLRSSTAAARGGLAARDAEVVKNVEEKLLARAEARKAKDEVFEITKETGALREALRARDEREEGQKEGGGAVGTLTWVVVAGVVGGVVGYPMTAQRDYC